MRKIIAIFLFFVFCFSYSQIPEKKMDTLSISVDKALYFDAKLQKTKIIDLKSFHAQNLSDILTFQSGISLKENGFGAVSSASLRGTTAQQTAVLWNGININSQFLGQSDFNTFRVNDFELIAIKYGAGSIHQGSGSIGGSVHLNSVFTQKEGMQHQLNLNSGSFSTFDIYYKNNFKKKKFSNKISFGIKNSKNNYPVSSKNYINTNGEYSNKSFNWNLKYEFNSENSLEIFNQYYSDERFFPIFSENQTKTKYRNLNLRNLVFYKNQTGKLESIIRFSRMEEDFSYYNNIENPERSSGGKAINYQMKIELLYPIFKKIQLLLVQELQNVEAKGKNTGIDLALRKTWVNSLVLKSPLSDNLLLESSVRKEINNQENVPILYSISSSYKPNKYYELQLKASKNYRLPSFNDLFWQPGGNINLKSESSFQVEFNQNFKFENLDFSISSYAMDIKNLIKWMPSLGSNFWQAQNFQKIYSYGLESEINYTKNWGKSLQFKINWSQYLSKSIDQETKMQLAYVPFYKSNLQLNFQFKNIGLVSQTSFQGKTFSTSDEAIERNIGNYFLQNIGCNFTFGKNKCFITGFYVDNIFNQIYERAAYYPMPLRNYNFNLKINI